MHQAFCLCWRPDGGSLALIQASPWTPEDNVDTCRRTWPQLPLTSGQRRPHRTFQEELTALSFGVKINILTTQNPVNMDQCWPLEKNAQAGQPHLQRGPGSTGLPVYYCVNLSERLSSLQQKRHALCAKTHFVHPSIISRTMGSEMWHPQ